MDKLLGELKLSLVEIKVRKEQADSASEARHWAVAYTDLEKIVAYVEYILKENEK
jgi:hypothetical protein